MPKFYPSTRRLIRKAFAIAPPTHGTDLGGLLSSSQQLNSDSVSSNAWPTVSGCEACSDLAPGSEVVKSLNEGGVAQKGIEYTIITSKYDEVVTPVPDASFVDEEGVRNFLN